MRFLRAALPAAVLIASLFGTPARAVDAVSVPIEKSAVDLGDWVERLTSDSDRVQVSTAMGVDGVVRKMQVRAREVGANWAVFALANSSDEQIERLIVVPHYLMTGSGLM